MSLKIEMKFDEAELKKLARIPEFVRFQAADKALRAMARPVIEKARSIAPSSQATGSRKKWSAKYKTNDKYQIDSGKEIGANVKKASYGSILYVGAKWPTGNKQQFNASPNGRKEVFWGRPQGTIYKPPERFMQKAFDETRSQQISAFASSLESSMKELNLG
jgi:hypothetical protein